MPEIDGRNGHEGLASKDVHAHQKLQITAPDAAGEHSTGLEPIGLIENTILRKAHQVAFGRETWFQASTASYVYLLWHLFVSCHSLGRDKNRRVTQFKKLCRLLPIIWSVGAAYILTVRHAAIIWVVSSYLWTIQCCGWYICAPHIIEAAIRGEGGLEHYLKNTNKRDFAIFMVAWAAVLYNIVETVPFDGALGANVLYSRFFRPGEEVTGFVALVIAVNQFQCSIWWVYVLPMYIRRMNLVFRQITACQDWFLSGARSNLYEACPMSDYVLKIASTDKVGASSTVSQTLHLAVRCVKSAEKDLASPILFQLAISVSIVAIQLVISHSLFTDYCNETSAEVFGVALFWLVTCCLSLACITLPVARVNSRLHALAKSLIYYISGSMFRDSEKEARQLGVAFSVRADLKRSVETADEEQAHANRNVSLQTLAAINAIISKQAGSFYLSLGDVGFVVDWPLVGTVVTVVGWVYGFSSTLSPCRPNPAA